MADEDTWSQAETVRALKRIEAKLDLHVAQFVPRELYDTQMARFEERLDEQGKTIVDVSASTERGHIAITKIRGEMVTRTGAWKSFAAAAALVIASASASAGVIGLIIR